jgi:hypothetical protein
MKEQRNLYTRQKIAKLRAQNKLSPSSRFRLWTTLTVSETEKFLGILLHVCISQRPNIESHWSTDPVLRCSFCPNVLSRDRFLSILSMFHLNDNSQQKKAGENGFDALFKVRPLLQKPTDKFQQTYCPEEAVTIDEGMCPFRGRANFRVYVPQKPNKYGMKLFILAELRTGYIWNFEVYHEKDPELDDSAAGAVK